MSKQAYELITFVAKEMSTVKYFYKVMIEYCYDMAIKNYGFQEPEEGREFVIEKVTEILKKQ
jgi:hypothetical protein